MNIKKIIVMALEITVCMIITTGCMPRLSDYRRITPEAEMKIVKVKTFEKGYDVVWPAIIKTLALEGYTINNQDKVSGTIFTGFLVTKEPDDFLKTAGYRHKLNIIVEKTHNQETHVTIHPYFEFNSAVGRYGERGSRWEKIDRPGDQQHFTLESRLFKAIEKSLQ